MAQACFQPCQTPCPYRRLRPSASLLQTAMAFKSVMKAMKSNKKSVIARGRGAKARVFAGKKTKTVGGLTKAGLKKNKDGKVVSRAASDAAKKRYAKTVKPWVDAVKAARKALGLS